MVYGKYNNWLMTEILCLTDSLYDSTLATCMTHRKF